MAKATTAVPELISSFNAPNVKARLTENTVDIRVLRTEPFKSESGKATHLIKTPRFINVRGVPGVPKGKVLTLQVLAYLTDDREKFTEAAEVPSDW